MFLDTSGLLCLYDSRDALHEDAVREFDRADRFLTHNYVLAELVALANARRLPRQDMLRRIQNIMDNPLVELLWVDESLHRAGLDLLAHREDKDYSLCDAISFLQMRESNVTEALTTDRHFVQEGLVQLLNGPT
jgi:uncharacterized protein